MSQKGQTVFRVVYYIQYALFFIFPLVWLLVLVTIIRAHRKSNLATGTAPESVKRPPRMLFIVVASYILLTITTSSIRQWLTIQHFDQVLTPNVSALNFTIGGKSVVVSNKQEIARFVELVKNAPSVSAHHTHDVDSIIFSFNDGAESYSLGRDSANADEYWLKVVRSAEIPELSGNLRQLHSPELTVWLQEHDLRK